MDSLLEKYRGFEVEIQYLTDNNMYKDRGRLSDFGDHWLELQKGGSAVGELFVIPASAVRLIKVIHPPSNENGRLLRAADPVVTESLKVRQSGQD